MINNINATPIDEEAAALAACYRLLLHKARERRHRLAKTASQKGQNANDQRANNNQDDAIPGES